MHPAQRLLWNQLGQRRGNIQRPFPFLGFGVDLPTNLQNRRVSTILSGNVLQPLLMGFEMISSSHQP